MHPIHCTHIHKTTLKDLKAHIYFNTVVVEYFNNTLSTIDKLSKQKVNKS
jgi:hypothetical protein